MLIRCEKLLRFCRCFSLSQLIGLFAIFEVIWIGQIVSEIIFERDS